MPDIGALLTGITGRFAQGRDYNLAVANAGASARLRLRRIELEEEQNKIYEQRVSQAINESRMEQKAKELQYQEDLRQAKREIAAEKTITEYEEATARPLTSAVKEIKAGRPVRGGPDVRATRLARKAVGAYDVLDREVPARLEEVTMTPTQRRARKAGIELTEAQTVESVRRAARPLDGAKTLTERDRKKLLDPNTPEDERRLIERSIFGSKTTIDGFSLTDISRILNDAYPEFGGLRVTLPENLIDDPVALYKHGAQLLRQTQDSDVGLVPFPDAEITKDSLFVR